MNGWFLAAGVYLILVGIAHALGGELVNFKNLNSDNIPEGQRAEFRASWHLFTVDLLLSGAILLALAIPDVMTSLDSAAEAISAIIALRYALHGLMWLVNALRVNRTMLWRAPQWTLMFIAAGLVLLGMP